MSVFRVTKVFNFSYLFILFVMACVNCVQGQSLDARAPSPIRTNEIVGIIGARDIGDARLTDHFYAFTGTPGDLLITVETRNLNGDIDIFTAGALRPVLKLALYAEVNAPVTKSIFLRQREDLILRVEARSPNDDDGRYHISFGGSFEPIAAGKDEEGDSEIASALPPVTRKGKRVSSVGARIEVTVPPPLEIAEVKRAEPSPALPELVDPPPAEPLPAETPRDEAKVESADVTPTTPTSRTTRTRAPARRGRNRAARAEEATRKPVTEEVPEVAETKSIEEPKSDTVAEISEKPATASSKSSKKSREVTIEQPEAASSESAATVAEPATSAKAPATRRTRSKRSPPRGEESTSPAEESNTSPQPEDLSKAKLIIEMLDGTRIERLMSQVRRVDVESGQIVVTASDGTIERIRLARVVRMSIGP